MPGKRVSDKSAFGKRSFESSRQKRLSGGSKLAMNKVLENLRRMALGKAPKTALLIPTGQR
jgi:hypothetical protein